MMMTFSIDKSQEHLPFEGFTELPYLSNFLKMKLVMILSMVGR